MCYEPFVKLYMDTVPADTTPHTEDMNTMLPNPDALSKGWAN